MSKINIGYLSVILGSLTLSFELFALQIIMILGQGLALGPIKYSPIEFLFEPVVVVGLLLTLAVIIYGANTISCEKEKKQAHEAHGDGPPVS